MRNKTIAELKAELGPLDVLNDRRQYRLAKLQQIARDKNLETRVERSRERKGWVGQPKGLLQVLWEQGWINEGQLERYTIDEAKDSNGEVLEDAGSWSLKYLMASCLNFAEETTALQHVVGKELFMRKWLAKELSTVGEWLRAFIVASHWNPKGERQVSRR